MEESSRKILDFLAPLGYQFDAIVYVNQNIVSDILQQTGGVFFENIQMLIDANNFSTVFSLLVESKKYQTDDPTSTPKQILFDFIPVFFEHVMSYPDKKALLSTIEDIFETKDVFFWSADANIQKIITDFSLTFSISPDTLDFTYPVFTSLSGNKSDRYMERVFTKKYEILGNCDVQTTFRLSQKHSFPIETQTRIQSLAYQFQALGKHSLDEMLFIAGKGSNKQYIRFFLPKNAHVETSAAYSVQKTDTNTILTAFLETPSGGKSDISFSYRVPNPRCLGYGFTFQKQPGLQKGSLEIQKN